MPGQTVFQKFLCRWSIREILLLAIIAMLVLSLTFTTRSDLAITRRSQTMLARVIEETSPTSQETSREIRLVVDPVTARFLTITPLDGSAGRLGNFCFRYAAALGIAAKNNMTLVLPDNTFVQSMREMFAIKAPLDTEVDIRNINFTQINEAHWGIFDESKFHLEAKHVSLSLVYSQSWRYFEHIYSQIREELQIDAVRRKKAASVISNIRDLYEKQYVVGIHVRRGDFLQPGHQKWGYAIATTEFFEHATKWFIDKYGADKVLFLVTSDDIPWCRYNINFQGAEHLFSLTSEPKEDFARLISCDHHIVSVGSFGWWSAWLGKGDVVYYKDFPTPNSNHAKNHNHFDYYPQNWIGMT